MLDFAYTQTAFKKLFNGFKKFSNIFFLVSQCVYLIYLIALLIIKSGNIVANILFFLVSLSYLGYYIYDTFINKESPENKKERKTVKRIKKISIIAINFYMLIVALYSLLNATNNVNLFSVLSTAFMLIFWILKIIFIIIEYLFDQIQLFFFLYLSKDLQDLPIVGNTLNNSIAVALNIPADIEISEEKEKQITEDVIAFKIDNLKKLHAQEVEKERIKLQNAGISDDKILQHLEILQMEQEADLKKEEAKIRKKILNKSVASQPIKERKKFPFFKRK